MTNYERLGNLQTSLNHFDFHSDTTETLNNTCGTSYSCSSISHTCMLNESVLNESMRPSTETSNIVIEDPFQGNVDLFSNSSFSAVQNETLSILNHLNDSTENSKNASSNDASQAADDQSDENSMLNLGFKCKGFRIGHINIQGLNNKMDQVRLMLSSDQNKIHIFGLSETKLQSFHPDNIYEIDGYQKPFRRDRKEKQGGGILLYAKNGVSCQRRSDLEHENLECIWLEVKPNKSKPFLVGHIYRPPNSGIIWNETFEDCIENVLSLSYTRDTRCIHLDLYNFWFIDLVMLHDRPRCMDLCI